MKQSHNISWTIVNIIYISSANKNFHFRFWNRWPGIHIMLNCCNVILTVICKTKPTLVIIFHLSETNYDDQGYLCHKMICHLSKMTKQGYAPLLRYGQQEENDKHNVSFSEVLPTLPILALIIQNCCQHWNWGFSKSLHYRPWHVDGLVQEKCNSIANALELHLSCTTASMCTQFYSVCLVVFCHHFAWVKLSIMGFKGCGYEVLKSSDNTSEHCGVSWL